MKSVARIIVDVERNYEKYYNYIRFWTVQMIRI